jgi:NAD(P)-dependent dehydrogenase (short-subunit alcohol dehydrogenase family)
VILVTNVYQFAEYLCKKFETMNLKNKVAVITGGNSGIGLGTAKELKALGATVIITGRRKEALEKAAQEIGAVYFMADQSKIEDIDTLSKAIQQQYGKVDILFINAGITGKPLLIENANEENFDAVMSINFRGAYFTLNRFIPLLNEGASVVFSFIQYSIHAQTAKLCLPGKQSGIKFYCKNGCRRTGFKENKGKHSKPRSYKNQCFKWFLW